MASDLNTKSVGPKMLQIFFIEKKDNRILLDSVGRRSGGKIITAEKTFGKNWTKADLRLI